ncbi:MAG: Cys-tRNA(Pro) deacylase [Candidatus Kapabacteria bacterium]|nr:Cys-tRNA(Pro) deacylase [Candidatus Kapabacteria bacterium]
MSKIDFPVTTAIRALRANNIEFTPFFYEYTEKGGTHQTSLELNVDEYTVVKTLVMESESEQFIVLMHGNLEVSTKELARQIDCKRIDSCSQDTALKITGYQFGGTSPFGMRKSVQVYAEDTIFNLDEIYINGGKRGFIIKIKSQDLMKVLKIIKVKAGINKN